MPAPAFPLRCLATFCLLWTAGVACTDASPSEDPNGGIARAIVVSIDALNEEILRRTLSPEETPALYRVFDRGVCADHAITAFPSLTASSHAVLWTGAYGDVNGATANSQHRLPRDRHTVLDLTSGFLADALSAEPAWITAGRAGVPVAGHHVTQGPQVPGYLPVEGERSAEAEKLREEMEVILQTPEVNVLRGYLWTAEPHRALTAREVEWTDPGGWTGLENLSGDLPPRTFRWETAVGDFHGVLHGRKRYQAVTVATRPDLQGAVTAHLAPVEEAPLEGRELARHFSPPLAAEAAEGPVHLRVRLFEVAPDGSDFLLYHPALHPVGASTPEFMRAYEEVVRGWVGNAGMSVYRSGGFGPSIPDGGDGLAEARYLETAELITRQFMRGSEWMWREGEPRLLLDYFPLSDSADHEFLGYLDPDYPGYDPALAGRMAEVRTRAWRLVDLRLSHLLELAEEGGAALFLTGDHGMRSSWNLFLPNVALREAGLLVEDAGGEVDLSRTRAVSPNGYWISINREAWVGGIVPPGEEEEVLEAARRALMIVSDGEGKPVVTRTFRPQDHPEMGIGGAAGGDLYWGTAPGYRSVGWSDREAAAVPGRLTSGHGFPPDESDMFTVFCGLGPGLSEGERRVPVRLTSVAPTVAEYLGMPAPADAVGPSVLPSWQER